MGEETRRAKKRSAMEGKKSNIDKGCEGTRKQEPLQREKFIQIKKKNRVSHKKGKEGDR